MPTNLAMDEKLKLASLLAERDRRVRENKLKYYAPYTYQKKFHAAGKRHGHRLMLAANRIGKCVIFQTLTSNGKTVGELFNEGKSFYTAAWDGRCVVNAKASAPFSKGEHDCYELVMKDGSRLGVADHHRVLLKNGNYCFVEDLYVSYKLQQDSARNLFYGELGVECYLQTPQDLTADYLSDSHQYDALLRNQLSSVLGCPQQQVDALDNKTVYLALDALELLSAHSHYLMSSLLSMQDLSTQHSALFEDLSFDIQSLLACISVLLLNESNADVQQLPTGESHQKSSCESLECHTDSSSDSLDVDCSLSKNMLLNLQTSLEFLQSVYEIASPQSSFSLLHTYSTPMILNDNAIIAVNPIGRNEVYDFEVEEFHNYVVNDVIHHNSYSGAMEVAYHATGLYPKWWKGRTFNKAVRIICGGVTTERARDILQKELSGEPSDPNAFGTGTLPKDCIVSKVRRAGIPNAISALVVKHKCGNNSKITIQSYESGKEAWMGDAAHFVWLDEEPPQDIYTQSLRAVTDLDGDIMMTFTPENGVTDIVRMFTQELAPHQYLQNATWNDAPHITDKVKKEMLAALPPHERDMRMKGIPMVGSGLVFSVAEDLISVDDFIAPLHWRHISGIDFGYDHPTAWVKLIYNPETDIVYLTQSVKIRQTIVTEIASVLKKKGADKIPVAWPHDGLKHDVSSGKLIKELYIKEGIKMLPEKFTNPPSLGSMEGTGGNGIEAGIAFILDRMETGRFRVFKSCADWFNEYRMYHRKNGKIVDKNDDLMAATRYAALSLRFSQATRLDEIKPIMPSWGDFQDDIVAY